jgi:enoyl-CoA hydratase
MQGPTVGPQPPVVDKLANGVLTITLNRPDKLNALDQQMIDALHNMVSHYEQRHDVYAVVFMGAGERAFAAGANIAQLKVRGQHDALLGINAGLFARIAHFPCPTIAAVRGFALGGGCELALACDLRVAGASAKFGQPETGLGIMAAAGATFRLPQLVGLGRARELLFTGRLVDADEALRIGLVNQVVPDDELAEAAHAMAAMITGNDPLATRLTKLALARNHGDTGAAQAFANVAQAVLFESPEKTKRMEAFLTRKRKG